ncbi:hypothetical protein [Vibrio sp. WXL210]|uniref:hypothetical protein n=1 Tax=Vibrio sp. WXL210 TaxID=3450709 RepID=UPI003EC56ABB
MTTIKEMAAAAKARGDKTFSTGKPCKNCGTDERYATDHKCLVCKSKSNKKHREENAVSVTEYQREYREKNKGHIKDLKKEHYDKNKEVIAEYQREYREKNREKLAGYQREYAVKNKEVIAEKARRNYHKRRGANKESIATRKREYYQKNKEKFAKYGREYREKNREKLARNRNKNAAYSRKRREIERTKQAQTLHEIALELNAVEFLAAKGYDEHTEAYYQFALYHALTQLGLFVDAEYQIGHGGGYIRFDLLVDELDLIIEVKVGKDWTQEHIDEQLARYEEVSGCLVVGVHPQGDFGLFNTDELLSFVSDLMQNKAA